MQQYRRNTSARRLTYCKIVFKLWLAALVVIGMMACTTSAYAFPLLFDLSAYPSLYDPKEGDAYNTTLRMFIGEVTTGLLGGFFNSDYQVGGVAIKNMASKQWWSLNPIVGYSEIQPLHSFYNVYADVVFNESNNTVYGVPYSDRFGTGPLVKPCFTMALM